MKLGSVAVWNDFTETLKIEHWKEVQAAHFDENVSVPIKQHVVHFPNPCDELKTVFDFHSFLSSDTQQRMASAIDDRVKKSFQCVKDRNVPTEVERVLGALTVCRTMQMLKRNQNHVPSCLQRESSDSERH